MAAFEVIALDTATPQLRAPGAGDSYTFPRAVELPLGTANGVLYLDGSKVVTSGSALTFDGANLGLGVTPSAWGSNYKALQLVYGSFGKYSSEAVFVSANAHATGDGAWKYTANGLAGLYYQAAGQHLWYTAPSGTAGNAISFTQAMTLDASGSLLLGETSQAYLSRFTLSYDPSSTNGPIVLDNRAYGVDRGGVTWYGGKYNTAGNYRPYGGVGARKENGTDGNSAGYLTFATNGNSTDATERARITSGGDLLVGTTTLTNGISATETALTLQGNSGGKAASFVSVNAAGTGAGFFGTATNDNTYLVSKTNHALIFGTNNTERARITSGGDLLVGTTSQPSGVGSARLGVVSDSNDFVIGVNSTHATDPYGLYIKYTAASPNGSGNNFFYFQDSTALRAKMQSNGGLANYSANDVNLSDRREKTNFAPAKSYLDTICAIPVQTFNYIDQSEDDPGLTLGVVAQDVQAVAPELVMESNWGTADNPKMRLSIYQTDLQYALMKCIQELKAQNDELRARVAALEAQT